MPLLETRVPYQQQALAIPSLDPTNPFNIGLSALLLLRGRNVYNAVTGHTSIAVPTVATNVINRSPSFLLGSEAGYVATRTDCTVKCGATFVLKAEANVTFAMILQIGAGSIDSTWCSLHYAGEGGINPKFVLKYAGVSNFSLVIAGAGNYDSGIAWTTGVPYAIVYMITGGGTMDMVVRRLDTGEVSISTGVSIWIFDQNLNDTAIFSGNDGGYAIPTDSVCPLILYANRRWSVHEAREWTLNPWQNLEEPIDMYWDTAGPPPTYSRNQSFWHAFLS